jgi:hypothetical protein
MADIDSDDQDFGPPSPPRFHSLGKRSLESMLENATRDRMESKRVVKKLKLTMKSAHTEYSTELWHQRFLGFRQNTLNIKE